MDRLEVAVMTFDLAPSGVVRNALRIAGAAQSAGLHAEIWTVQDTGSMRTDVPPGVPVRSFGAAISEGYSRKQRANAALQAQQALATALQERRPGVALSAGNHFHELAVAAARLARPLWTGRMVGRVSNDLPRFSWAPHQIPWSVYKRAAARRRLNAMDRLVTVSHALRRDLIRKLLVPGSKISVVPNGIDIPDCAIRASEPTGHTLFEQGEPPVVLGAGRLVPQKDFSVLIRAFAEARKSMPMRLLLLGDGPDREALADQAHSLGVSSDVIFAGFIPNILPYLRQASLFVLPSRWEGMSNALLEALALGCPSVATRCAGSVELFGEALAGQIVPVGDGAGLARAILMNVADPPDRRAFQARAAEFDLRTTLDRYISILDEELSHA